MLTQTKRVLEYGSDKMDIFRSRLCLDEARLSFLVSEMLL